MKSEISIIMSVYNEPLLWLKESIESILNQTFKDFEFIIVLDNPNNIKIKDLIISYKKKDSRIIFLENTENLGLAKSLNKCLDIAKGKYIARMDGDDISLPNRLEKQYEFLEKNGEIDLVGSWVYKIDERGTIYGTMKTPTDIKIIKKYILYRTVSFHPTWMLKRDVYEKLNGYRPFIVSQDYDFLLRVIDNDYNISNIPELLLKYRINSKNVSNTKAIIQFKSTLYALRLHDERKKLGKDEFDINEYLKYIETSSFMKKLYSFSNKMFLKAMTYKDKKEIFLMLLYLFLSLASPYQLMRLLRLIKGKFIYV